MTVDEERAGTLAGAQGTRQGSMSSSDQNKATTTQSQGRWSRHYLQEEVDVAWADILLIVCFLISGLVDSVAFDVWNCFASMQTGNTIFVGLGVSSQPNSAPPYQWSKSLIAIVAFIMGAFFFGTFHRIMGPLKRWVLVASFLIQALLLAIPAALASAGVVNNHVTVNKSPVVGGINGKPVWTILIEPVQFIDLVPLAMLAFQGAGQVVASRVLKYNELPTVVVTSLFTDLMSDAKLLSAGLKENPKRNRRVAGVVLLFAGALAGGFFVKSWAGLAGALWIASFLKAAIALAWIFWAAEKKL